MKEDSEIITYSDDGKLNVPDFPVIPFIEGDGIGPDIWRAARRVLDAAVSRSYGGDRKIQWLEVLAGEKAFNQTQTWLPEKTLEKIRIHRVAIKGPLTTPVGEGIRSINVSLRQELDLYACVRPTKYITGIPSPVLRPEQVDMVIFRENTEDVYMGLEWKAGSVMAKKIIDLVKAEDGREIRAGSGIGLKPISRFGTRRLVRMAIEYAIENKKKSVTLVHKGNIMKFTEGAFRSWGYEVAREEFGEWIITEENLWQKHDGELPPDKIVIKDRIADAMFQQILLRPAEYDVLAMPNLNGDYMSDALSAMVGGLGLAPGANIGDGYALFEATHGTAPKYANQDKVNPGSLALSGEMMLRYMGWMEAADLIIDALFGTGLSKDVGGVFGELIARARACMAPILAVDLPSGLSADTGQVLGSCLPAHVTVTFGAPKRGHLLQPGSELSGDLHVADIGFPPQAFETQELGLWLLCEHDVADYLQRRPSDSHKGRFGHLLVLAGSESQPGAAGLAVREGVQMHGGIGMTDEYDIGLYMKRDRALGEFLGDAYFHAGRVADLSGY